LNILFISSLYSQFTWATLDSFITAKMDQHHFPGMQVCIVENDHILWTGAYGYANIEQDKAVSDSTLFQIASVAKPFAGTALMQLWEKELFELDDDINNYLSFEIRNPYFPNDPITFRMLLTHTAGIADNWARMIQLYTYSADSPVSLESFVENYFKAEGTYYNARNWRNTAPGSSWNYTDAGYALIGYLVAVLSDTTFADYSKYNIFDPLGMNQTSWFLADLDSSKIATPYIYNENGYSPSAQIGTPFYPGGQLFTSAVQLATFLMEFNQKDQAAGTKILKSATMDSMTTVQNSQVNQTQGLTWIIEDISVSQVGNRTICGHTGGWDIGINARASFILGAENIGIIILTNRWNSTGIYQIEAGLFKYGILNSTVGIEDLKDTDSPKKIGLNQNYPNPFNPSTTIEFSLPKSGYCELKVYNILGKEVSTLVSKKLNQGNHTYTFDGKNLASGIYYYQLVAGDFREVKKMILLK
jgi:CubicO group peptidase (beta-lactamase class C family)